ncbi:uncharacterized protein LOC122296689 [Carya illinoinensis]|uniref:uncharacterized protein LOC122296689 n=1 Tax=Carya illinoinensis TaxID=32201 RepID=UPI001C71A1BB|nr:uncharacterized protein LOC122296689 [Carya illinoinensis]
MKEDLTQRWSSLKLTEAEQQELFLPDEDILSSNPRGNLCLLASILNDRTLNREAFKNTMAKVWNTSGWLTFKEFCPNKFLLEFQLLSDKKKVLHGRPWSFDCHRICLKEFESDLSPIEVQFNLEPFWVQAHNLPFVGMNRQLGERIGEAIGKVHTVEVDDQGHGWGSFLRIKVDVDVTKPLVHGRMVNLGGKQSRSHFKYERLPNFCFKCGLLKHVNGKCPNFGLTNQSQDQYRQWMRAPNSFPPQVPVKKYGGTPEYSSQGSPP